MWRRVGRQGGYLLRLRKLIQEPWESRRERSAVITCGSLISESTSRHCVYFSLFPRGAELLEERPRTHTSRVSSTLYNSAPYITLISSRENYCVTVKTEWQLCPSQVCTFFLKVMVKPWNNSPHPWRQAHNLFKYVSGCCCCCDRAVITSITASLAGIVSWQMLASLSWAQWQ